MRKLGALGLLLLLGCVFAPARLHADADIQGEWTVEFSAGAIHNEDDMEMYVNQDGTRLTGHIDWNSSATDYPIKGTIAGDAFQIVWTTSVNGVVSDITFRGTVKGDEINGTVEIPGHESGELYARRISR